MSRKLVTQTAAASVGTKVTILYSNSKRRRSGRGLRVKVSCSKDIDCDVL
jgi:hypothetical protein